MSKEKRREASTVSTVKYFGNGDYFQHKTVDVKRIDEGTLRARVLTLKENDCLAREWREFKIIVMDEDFLDWNFTERITRIDRKLEGSMTAFGGAHNPAVASYGGLLFSGTCDHGQ